MRPVTKWEHTNPAIVPPIQEEYNPYSDARDDLERNIGAYCSYCERPIEDEASHIEHIQAKGLAKYAHLRFKWSNFLFSCHRCNGSDNKGNKDVILGEVHLPNLNNTMLSIVYEEGGFIKINPALQNQELIHAEALINLVGLDKRPGHDEHRPKDKRWQRRRKAWEIAKRYLNAYTDGRADILTIIDLAKGYGFWSVWYTLFELYPEVRQHLITAFNGTAQNCFDAANNYQPIPRNPHNAADHI